MRVGDVEEYCTSQHVSGCQDEALLIELAVDQVIIAEVGIQRELFLMLPVALDLPIVLLLELTNTETSFISVALATASWMACRGGSVVGVEVRGEIPEGAHRNFPNFPANLGGYVEDQKTVDARLIATGIA